MSAAWCTGYVSRSALSERLEASDSAFTVGFRCSSASVTRDRNGTINWLSVGTPE